MSRRKSTAAVISESKTAQENRGREAEENQRPKAKKSQGPKAPRGQAPRKPRRSRVPPFRPTPTAMFVMLIKEFGDETIEGMVRTAIAKRAGLQTIREYLDSCDDGSAGYDARYLWENRWSVDGSGKRRLSAFKVAAIVRLLGLSVDDMLDPRPLPWRRLKPRQKVALIVGKRRVPAPHSVQGGFEHYAIGPHDFKAAMHLSSFAQGDPALQVTTELHLVSADSMGEEEDAAECFAELKGRSDIGGILCIGSPLVNPATSLIAEEMFSKGPRPGAPVFFRWPQHVYDGLRSQYLSLPAGDVGVGVWRALPSDPDIGRLFEREADRTIREQTRDGVSRGQSFLDAGILAVDCRPPRYFLGVVAGHGGLATFAAAHAATHPHFAECLEQAQNPGPNDECAFDRDCVCQVIRVARRKRSEAPIDDLYFDKYQDPDEERDLEPGAWTFE